MGASVNITTLMARVIGKVEIEEGRGCAKFELDVRHAKKVSAKNPDDTQSKIIVEAHGPLAQAANYIAEGVLVHIVGYLEEDRWHDPTYNRWRSQVKVIAQQIRFPQRSENKEEPTLAHVNAPAEVTGDSP